MEIIDNFLPPEELSAIQEEVFVSGFPWHFNSEIIDESVRIGDSSKDYQFTHVVWDKYGPVSNLFNLLNETIVKRLNIEFLGRLKLNLNPITETHQFKDVFHVDQEGDAVRYGKRKTAVFYLNTNNGYTLFEDGRKVDCVENRIAIFDSNERHTGVTTTDTKCKVVLNINWLE